MTHINHESDSKQETVEISKLALMALINGTLGHVNRNGHYANLNQYGRIEIADALRQGLDPLGQSYDPRNRLNCPKSGSK